MTQVTPGMAFNPSMMTRRRRSNSPTILATSSWGPPRPSTAAHWAIDVGFEVTWLCTSVIALMTGLGPAAYPMRHPVIAYALEHVFTVIVRDLISGDRDAMDRCRPS